MRTKIIHPVWTHIPAIIALAVLIIYTITSLPLPDTVPIHFGGNGLTDSYGSPWTALGLSFGLSIFYIVLSFVLDELWARQESAKTFNWISLFDELIVGAIVGANLGYMATQVNDAGLFRFPWVHVLLGGGIAVGLGIIFEVIRPFRPYDENAVVRPDKSVEKELTGQLSNKANFIYWDYQNPLYVALLTTILPLVMFVAAVLSWFSQPWVAIVLIVVGLLLFIPYGGLRVLVTRQNIIVHFGLLGLKVLSIRTDKIATVELHKFAPLKDFGGYGIRFNREMTAYYLNGNEGVKITTTEGKKYLIGSNKAGIMASVIRAALSVH